MRNTERVIAAHKNSLTKRPPDRRPNLISLWEQFRTGGPSKPAVETAIQLVGDGSANEVELGFYILADLALDDPSVQRDIIELTKHKSAKTRRTLAFYLSKELPPEFITSVITTLLQDKAASVRIGAIDKIGMRNWKMLIPQLHALRSREQNEKVIKSLQYWIPLLEAGYQVKPQGPGHFEVTALTGQGISMTTVQAPSPDDPRITETVQKLLNRHP